MSYSTVGDVRGYHKYALSPIVLLVPMALLAAATGKGFRPDEVPALFTAGVSCIYLIMACFYVMLCRENKTKAAVAVACVTDGMMLIFFSAMFGSGMILSFLGFIVIISGIGVGISMAVPSGESLFARRIDRIVPTGIGVGELRKIIDSIQFPCVFLEKDNSGSERILAFNAPFADDFKLDKKKILENSLESLLDLEPGTTQMKYDGEEWIVKRTTRGRQILILFSPVVRSKEAAKIEVFDAIDPSTGLYVEGFMKYKAKSDVESINRGKRRVSVAFFKLSFPQDATAGVKEEEIKLAHVVVGRIIQQSIRACDSAYRTGGDEMLLFMPDTPNSGSKIVVSRIYAGLKSTSAMECPILAKGILDYVDKDFVGGADLPPYDKIVEEMSIAFYRKYPDLSAAE
jgi:diguanylate cyclase (GGDEF)-like protein